MKVFISVDMEGISGIGTAKMTSSSGKDYGLGRELMTGDVNAVVAAILEHGPAEILVNDPTVTCRISCTRTSTRRFSTFRATRKHWEWLKD